MLDRAGKALENGMEMYAQIAARPFGMLFGFPGHHAFTHRPTFRKLKAEVDRDELAGSAGRPGGARGDPGRTGSASGSDSAVRRDVRTGSAQRQTASTPLGDPPDYEPTPDQTVAAIAERRGEDPLATMYDLMLEPTRGAMLMLPFYNYAEGNHDAIYEMLTHPAAVSGSVRRRCALRHDLRCVLPDLPADPLGARPSPRPEVLAGIRGAQADPGHRNAFRPLRSRCHRRGQEGRPQRHRHGCAHPRVAADGLRPARRWPQADPGRVGLRRDRGQRCGDPAPRRRHRCAGRAG